MDQRLSSSTDRIRLLHVDDEPGFADLATTMLEREDGQFIAETVTSASDGLNRLADATFDCIISDYDMPGQNGIEFLETVRDEYPDLPFILFTGKGSEEIASDAISAGVTDYLQKGNGTDQYTVLANRVRNAVEGYRSQRALAERNQELRRYKQMVNSMHEAACLYDAAGRFELVNSYLADWYGTTPEALEGESSMLIPRIREQADGDPYQDLLDGTRDELSGEIDADFPGHGYGVLAYRLTPLRVNGNVDGVVAVARDITDSREQQAELERQNDRLEEFASVISHDLRSPLSVVEGRLALAREDCESAHLDPIGDAVDRMNGIIDDILWLAQEGRDIGETEAVALQPVIEDAWSLVADDQEEAELILDEGSGGWNPISADRERLRQLLDNLLRNAIDHAGPDVTVRVEMMDGGFAVEDDGPGIPDTERERVFESGYSTAESGIGFGLSIVRQVAEAHGWDVRVTDGSGGGARFEITGVEFSTE